MVKTTNNQPDRNITGKNLTSSLEKDAKIPSGSGNLFKEKGLRGSGGGGVTWEDMKAEESH